jgi:predicted GIY-YIG superfamily endonuclease
MSVKGIVYLIHFHSPLGRANHYLGWTVNLQTRMDSHRNNSGARILRACNIIGITWEVVRTWEQEDRHFERKLKNLKNAKRLCPVCSVERGAKCK